MKKILFVFVILVLVLGSNAGVLWYTQKQAASQVGSLELAISTLQKEISSLRGRVASSATTAAEAEQQTNLSLQELQNRKVIHQKSQDELLTAAVAKVAPAVVSIVISKDVPQLEVVYVNPFGNDPLFKDIGVQVPTYKQKGTVSKKVGAGTGFLITSNGYILTNKHVVQDAEASYTVLLSNGKQLPATVVYKDGTDDVAIVKVSGSGFAKAELGDSGSLQLGQSVLAIGNALGEYSNSVSTGIISGLNRSIEASSSGGASEKLSGVIQTDAAINPGNSGGPLLNLDGKVVGINVATVVGSSNVSFSIPINSVKNIVTTVVGK